MKRIKVEKKQKNKDSNRWLERHLNDEYVIKSKIDGYRSRSSYKLIQINKKFNFFKRSSTILDLGCSPGGWLQVSQKLAPKNSKILGVDKINLEFIPDVKFIKNDIFDDDVFEQIDTFFEGKKIDLILSDMSPNSSGNKKVDHLRIISLIEKVLDISEFFLSIKINNYLHQFYF